MGPDVECPNCGKEYVVIDTTTFRCSGCGFEVDVQAGSRVHSQRIAKARTAKLRGESFRKARYFSIPVALGFLLHGIGLISLVLFVLAIVWFVVAKVRRTPSQQPRLLAICLLLFVIGSIAGDSVRQPTALCRDMTYSYSAHESGTCSWHGGGSEWNPGPWWARQ